MRSRDPLKFFENAETERDSKAYYGMRLVIHIDDVFSERCRFDFILGYETTDYFIENVDIPAGMRAANYFRATRASSAPREVNRGEFRPHVANI